MLKIKNGQIFSIAHFELSFIPINNMYTVLPWQRVLLT
jgi:hypothetical protein